MYTETEDLVPDVIAKAQRGLNISDLELESLANISSGELAAVKKLHKNTSHKDLKKIAQALQLNESGLIALADGWLPEQVSLNGLKQIPSPYYGAFVNAYVVWDPASLEAFIFDTGMDAHPILQFIKDNTLRPKALFLTHAHTDHIACLPHLQRTFKNIPTYIHENEALSAAKSFKSLHLKFENIEITSKLTPGHSPGGTTYLIQGLERPIAIVGDALFAGSQGGTGSVHYKEALDNNKREIFSLTDNTILCPGHGPLSTVREEKRYNCFYLPASQ